jgi:arginyl-tRNA synthetase
MVKDVFKQHVGEAVKTLFPDVSIDGVHVEPAENFGDYMTNVAMVLAKRVGKNPREVAEMIAEKLRERNIEHVEKIEVAGPGFINFYLHDSFYINEVRRILSEGHGCGRHNSLARKKIIVEYTDPNPFKVFHIGHLLPNVIGEAFSRMFEFAGAEVKRSNYQGDVGLHVAKSLWGMLRTLDQMPDSDASLEKKTKYLGEAYVVGANVYDVEKNEKAIEEIKEINKQVYDCSGDPKLKELYDKGRAWSLYHFEEIYKILGTRFDYYFFESQTYVEGTRLVKEYLEKGVFEKSEGAVIFPGSKYGLHDRVFINNYGVPTYDAKDLGLAMLKEKTYVSDVSMVVTGTEQDEYFKVLLKALEQIDPKIAQKTEHVGHGLLRMTTGKMSSRKGNVITGESLLKETIENAREKIAIEGVSEHEKDLIAEQVGVAAIKFSILRTGLGKNIVYDPTKALSFEGDSGPYLQYTNARALSLLRKADEKGIKVTAEKYQGPVTEVEKELHKFKWIVKRATEEKAPHQICTYLLGLAGAFNSYYAQNPIIDSEDAPYRLALTRAVSQVLKNGLYVLGMSSPERM